MMLCQLRHHSPDTLQGAPSAARVVSARRGLKNDADSIGISEMRRLCLRFKAEAQRRNPYSTAFSALDL